MSWISNDSRSTAFVHGLKNISQNFAAKKLFMGNISSKIKSQTHSLSYLDSNRPHQGTLFNGYNFDDAWQSSMQVLENSSQVFLTAFLNSSAEEDNITCILNSTESLCNGTSSSWFPSLPYLNLTGNRGGGVLHQTPVETGISKDDASWVLTATFIIFTMQSGFGLLEGGCVSIKNETNIMVKNVVDVVLGGLTYWMFGYGLSFGKDPGSNFLFGWGSFFLNADEEHMGDVFTTYFFQLSFATTATTVVSGAVAERFNFVAYVIFSAVNTIVYCIPAGWLWAERGFLYQMGVIDIAGSCGVHLCGGASAFVAAILVGPRLGRYDYSETPLPMGSPTNALLGTFILWWGWLGFNCGSTLGILNDKWKYAARTAVTTVQASIGGGLVGMSISWFQNRQLEIGGVVNSILGALVSNTAGCSLYTTYEALVVGMVGGAISTLSMPLIDKLHIDDPVGATSVHGLCGFWAMIAIGLFVKADTLIGITNGRSGVLRGGGFYLLGVQLLACVVVIIWSSSITFILLKIIDKFIVSIRMSEWEELVGADFAEHGIRRGDAGITRATSVVGFEHHGHDFSKIPVKGDNPCHVLVLQRLKDLQSRRGSTLAGALSQIREENFETNAFRQLHFSKKNKNDNDDELPVNFVHPFGSDHKGNMLSTIDFALATGPLAPKSAASSKRSWTAGE
ncbi:Ammonium transporter [Trinorchestia longiramus]|nr:Ammonium transporter [Trinorchestia longiramus]